MKPIPLQETQLAELFRLREKCAAQAAVIEKLLAVIQWIESRCGGESMPNWENTQHTGHSRGLILDRTNYALAIPTDSKQILTEWLDKQLETFYHAVRNEALEDAAKVALNAGYKSTGVPAYEFIADKIRSMKETK